MACPKCGKTMIKRIPRNVLQKYLFPRKKRYQCKSCKTKFMQ